MEYLYRFPMGVTSHRMMQDFPDSWYRLGKVIRQLILSGKAEHSKVYGIKVVRLTKAARQAMQEAKP